MTHQEQAINMLKEAIHEIENGRAQYIILAILGPEPDDQFSICTGTRESAERAAEVLSEMLLDVQNRPVGMHQ